MRRRLLLFCFTVLLALSGCTVSFMYGDTPYRQTLAEASENLPADPLLPSQWTAEDLDIPYETASALEIRLPEEDPISLASIPLPVGKDVKNVNMPAGTEYVSAYHNSPAGTVFDLSFRGLVRGTELLYDPALPLVLYVSDGVNPKNVSVPADDKTVYLTFDDGPSLKNTPAILDTLDQYGVKATFFVVGSSLERYPDIVRDIYSRGHKIGCHSYSHVYKDIYADAESMLREIEKWEETVERALGFVPEERLFRFPGGSTMCRGSDIHAAVAAAGYRAFDWNALNNDSLLHTRPAGVTKEAFMKEAVTSTLSYSLQLKGSPHIVLMHDTYPETAELLSWMIEYIQEKGCTFSTLDALESGWLY